MADQLLTQFFKALRGVDVRVSTSEAIDAMQTVDLFGYADRTQLKSALAMVLAKSEVEKQAFDLCFDHFFSFAAFDKNKTEFESAADSFSENASQEAGGENYNPAEEGGAGDELEQLLTDAQKGGQGLESSLGKLLLSNDEAELQIQMSKAGSASNVTAITTLTQKGLYGRRIMEAMGLQAMEEEMWQLEKSEHVAERATAQALRHARDGLREAVKDYVAQQYLLQAKASEQELREEVMRSMKLQHMRDFQEVHAAVQKIAKRLVAIHSRRRKVYKRGQLDVRSTIRSNVSHDGVLFNTHWKAKRVDRPKVIALCDVSGSVSTVARFLLMFLYSLQEIIPGVRAFVFANRTGEVTELFEQQPVMEACAEAIDSYMGSTDYGSSLQDFVDLCLQDIDNKTTVLILGDARNNRADPRSELMKLISDRAKRVIWLNPESRYAWNSGDSVMRSYTPYCSLAETCNSLNHLERLVSKLMK